MKLHTRAALNLRQRQEVKMLHENKKISIRRLALQFGVNPTTIQRWISRESPLDKSSAPVHHATVITPEYRSAIVAYRKAHSAHGPIRISQALVKQFPFADRGTILRILQDEGLTRPAKKRQKPRKPIPVGRHRIQMDVQQLPAVKGDKGFEYKITAIHLRTRLKYSEIHPNRTSETVAGVLKRALDLLPPFFSYGPTTPWSSQ